MKKVYSKPDIFFESFTLNTNIAAGCEEKPHNETDYCGAKFGKSIIFISKEYGCSSIIAEGDTSGPWVDSKGNGLCYHNPSVDYNVFNS